MRFPLKDVIVKPLLSSLIMGIIVHAVWQYIFGGKIVNGDFVAKFAPVVICILVGSLSYVLFSGFMSAINKQQKD